MAQIIKEIRVDVSQPCNLQAILAKQYDCNSRFLKITLTDCGTKIDVSNTSKVTINTNRPDGQSKSFVGITNGDGTVTVPLPQWSLSIAGTLICDVSVTDTSKNERLTTMDIFVEVKEAANDNTDISENPDGEIRVITPTQKIDENSSDDEYPSAKAVYDLDNITASASGSAITIDSANAPLQNLKLYGHTEQNGTPTPDAPVPLVSVGDSGSFEVGVYGGKNLIEITSTTQTINGITFTINADKSITVNGTATETAQIKFCEMAFIPKGEYIISGYPTHISGVEYYFKASNESDWVQRRGEVKLKYTENVSVFGLIAILKGITVNNLTFYPMLRLATETDSTYEPCNKQTLTMPYELPSINEYRDEIDFNKGVRTQKVLHITADDITKVERAMFGGFGRYTITCGSFKAKSSTVRSNLFQHRTNVLGSNDIDGVISAYTGTSNLYVRYDAITTNSEFLQFLKDNNFECNIILATPIETPLTEIELNAYRHLMTNKGTTTILSEAEAEVDYYINKPNAQAIGNIHSQVNKDYLRLQQAIISTGGSTL